MFKKYKSSIGIFFNLQNRSDCVDCKEKDLPNSVHDRMLQFMLSDYSINTAAHALHQANVSITVRDQHLPQWAPVRLFTRDFLRKYLFSFRLT